MNSVDGRLKANAAIVPAGENGNVTLYVTGDSNVVLDIDGYFTTDTSSPSTELQFYPLTPCRVADTRQTSYPAGLGAPSLVAGVSRSFPIQSSTCGIPAAAQAYSLNFTVVPQAPLGYLAAWPADVAVRPTSSILNSLNGEIVANAAIVPGAKTGSNGPVGSVSVYATANTDLVIDINGYFAPAASAPNGLSLFTLTPCRFVDTRINLGAVGPIGGWPPTVLNVSGGACGPLPSSSVAYVTNTTMVPAAGPVGFLSMSPDPLTTVPMFSTTNSLDGSIVSNMAVVPSTNGMIDAYASQPTQLVVDMSGYFGPPVVTVSISPAGPLTLSLSQHVVLSATVTGTPDTSVTWSVVEGSSCGSVTNTGTYTAPATVPSSPTCHVQAQSGADPSGTASVAITLTTALPPTFTTTPPSSAQEGMLYTYAIGATDPSSGTVGFTLAAGPAGATLTGNMLTWTPTHAQSRTSNSFSIQATTSEGGGALQNWTVTPTGTINGSVVDTYVTQTGLQQVPVDLSNSTFTGYVPNGSGGYTTYPGTVTGTGTFTIPGVPAGGFAISWQNTGHPTQFVATYASDVDFGQGHLGRPNTVIPVNPVTVNFTMRLVAGNSLKDEQYQWYSPDVNLLDTFEGTISGNPPIFTAIQEELGALIEGTTFNDQAYLTRAIQKPPSIDITNQAVVVTEYYPAGNTIQETDGGTVNVGTTTSPAQMINATRAASAELNLAAGQFHAQLLAATVSPPPANSAETTQYDIEAQSYGTSQGQVGLVPSLLHYPFQSTVPYLNTDEDHGAINFSTMPFPNSTVLYDYSQQFAVPFNVPSSSGTVFGPISEIRTVTATAPTPSSSMAPMVGAVVAPTINGKSFFSNQTGSPANAVLAWSSPTIGTPTAYRVQIFYVNPTGGEGGTGSLDEKYDFVFPTVAPPISFPVPNFLLESGKTYVFTVTALDNPAAPSVVASPFREALPYGLATSVSGEVTIQ